MEWMYLAFMIIAFLYGSVGHGGASGYIALMVLMAFPQAEIKTNALMLNVLVSFVAFIHYFNKKDFPYRLFALLAVCSIPMAFLGGMWTINDRIYKILLGVVLLIPIAKFSGFFPNHNFKASPNVYLTIFLGLFIGLLSGLLGIGGGIILSPIVLLLGWCNVKQTSAISALFIFVNSVSGLLGKSQTVLHYSDDIFFIAIFTLIGGFLGAYSGSKKLPELRIKQILATVLLIASYKLCFT